MKLRQLFYLKYLTLIPSIYGLNENTMPYTYDEAYEKLKNIGEEHILDHWNTLAKVDQHALLCDIEQLDTLTFQQQQAFIYSQKYITDITKTEKIEAFTDYAYSGSEINKEIGRQILYSGKVAAILVAGGQGTRLSFNGPKGTFPISVIAKKSLFQIFAEKVAAASQLYGQTLPLAIMTSPQNHTATIAFFEEHNKFGLKDEQLYFFMQTEKPFLNDANHLMLEGGLIAKGPDGNGLSLHAFEQAGIMEKWQKLGISIVNYILIDNPLADPFDAELIGFHATNKAAMTIKCVEKYLPEERVGVVVATNEGPKIVEYSEMDENERHARATDGGLKHRCANISVFCFDMNFIKKAASMSLPWHLAYKATSIHGNMGWKFETFIFDIMPSAGNVQALLFPREECFAPLKNEKGNDSIDTVQASLLARDKAVLENIVGRKLPDMTLELAQDFYYPSKKLLLKWHNHTDLLEGYIDP